MIMGSLLAQRPLPSKALADPHHTFVSVGEGEFFAVNDDSNTTKGANGNFTDSDFAWHDLTFTLWFGNTIYWPADS